MLTGPFCLCNYQVTDFSMALTGLGFSFWERVYEGHKFIKFSYIDGSKILSHPPLSPLYKMTDSNAKVIIMLLKGQTQELYVPENVQLPLLSPTKK